MSAALPTLVLMDHLSLNYSDSAEKAAADLEAHAAELGGFGRSLHSAIGRDRL